jgi:hypothetical protein
MLDRVAIATAPLRIVGVALLMFVIARIDVPASAIMVQPPEQTKLAASAIRCTHGHSTIRTRSPGMQLRFLTRDLTARRQLIDLGR